LKIHASCGQKDPRKPVRKAAVIMAQSSNKSSGKAGKANVGAKTRSAERPLYSALKKRWRFYGMSAIIMK